MLVKMMARVAAGTLAAGLALLGAPAAHADSAHVATPAIVYYDDSQAGSWAPYVPQAIANWNDNLHNVRFQSDPGQATVYLVASSGWPQTSTDGPGSGTVYLGQQAVDQGYDPTRITAHELGHILGLPDNYNGDCTLLMSGHSAGTACTNAVPAASEIQQVDQIFAGAARMFRSPEPRVYSELRPAA